MGSKPVEGLTPRQRECLTHIIHSLKVQARIPSVSELAAAMVISRGSIDRLLVYLEDKGYIKRAGVTSGFLKLLKDLDGDPVTVTVTILKKKP